MALSALIIANEDSTVSQSSFNLLIRCSCSWVSAVNMLMLFCLSLKDSSNIFRFATKFFKLCSLPGVYCCLLSNSMLLALISSRCWLSSYNLRSYYYLMRFIWRLAYSFCPRSSYFVFYNVICFSVRICSICRSSPT